MALVKINSIFLFSFWKKKERKDLTKSSQTCNKGSPLPKKEKKKKIFFIFSNFFGIGFNLGKDLFVMKRSWQKEKPIRRFFFLFLKKKKYFCFRGSEKRVKSPKQYKNKN